jgi:hypothetical protein
MSNYKALPDQDLESNEKLLPRGSEDEAISIVPARDQAGWKSKWLMIGHGIIEIVLVSIIIYLAKASSDPYLYNSQVNFSKSTKSTESISF